MTETTPAPYRCPTPCDPDCELNGWSCHEFHQVPWKRGHDPQACESQALTANILSLVDAGWFLQIGRCEVPDGQPPVWFAALRRPAMQVEATHYGPSVAEAAGKAAQWAREGAST